MPVGGAAAAPAGGAAAAPVEEEKVAEKTEFNVKLEKFDAAAKAKLIREIKNIIPGINLVEVKQKDRFIYVLLAMLRHVQGKGD